MQATTVGHLTDFNIWSYEMTIAELNSDTCEARGDLVSWETLNEKGSVPRTVFRNPTCNGKLLFSLESSLDLVYGFNLDC